jgi:hypothetical protein
VKEIQKQNGIKFATRVELWKDHFDGKSLLGVTKKTPVMKSKRDALIYGKNVARPRPY